MIDQEKLYNIWVYLQAEPLFWLTLTIGSYIISDLIYRKSNLFPLLNPGGGGLPSSINEISKLSEPVF